MPIQIKTINFIRRRVPPFTWIYFTLLFGWLVAFWLVGDDHGFLALFNHMWPAGINYSDDV